MTDTAIEWAARPGTRPKVWNATTGCNDDVISPGCERCYARQRAHHPRLRGKFGYPADEPFRVTLHPNRLDRPLHWRKPCTVFVDSMGDLFHEDVPGEFIAAVFGVMAACPQHTFMVLTKRADRMAEWFEQTGSRNVGYQGCYTALREARKMTHSAAIPMTSPWPLPNVYLGVTAEDQPRADERWETLRRIPAAVHWISCEPLLSHILVPGISQCQLCGGTSWSLFGADRVCRDCGEEYEPPGWLVAGAETGPGARPMDPEWAQSLRDQCRAAGVPFFFKKPSPGQQTPPDLAIREWPEVRDA